MLRNAAISVSVMRTSD